MTMGPCSGCLILRQNADLSLCSSLPVENESHEGKRKVESVWPVFRIHHQRSRYVYDLYYKRKAISKELYDYLLKNGYADANLIAKWKKVCIFLFFDIDYGEGHKCMFADDLFLRCLAWI